MSHEAASEALDGVTVLVTRPAPQAEPLCGLIMSHGGDVIRFPTIEIVPNDHTDTLRARIGRIDRYQLVIFVSRNAVTHGARLILGARDSERPAVCAIGPSTARELKSAGLHVSVQPREGYTSETLLAEPAFADLTGAHVLIVCGAGGRELLGDTLRARGADVIRAEVYRRTLPAVDPAPLIARWRGSAIDLATATSVETLDNLARLLGDAAPELLRETTLVTPSERVVKRAASMGLPFEPLRARGPDDPALLEAMLAWRAAAGNAPG